MKNENEKWRYIWLYVLDYKMCTDYTTGYDM